MKHVRCAIGIDLGGTNLKAGIVDESGRVVVRKKVPVGKSKSWNSVVRLISDVVSELRNESSCEPCAIGAGIPGIVDFEKGVVVQAPQFPDWKNVSVGDDLARLTSLPVVSDNDANMHALGEAKFGAGCGGRNMVLLTLGSGIGGGLILDGRLYRGDFGFAGEVGHIVVEPEGVACNCGGSGCLEQYAASRAFKNFASELGKKEISELFAGQKANLSKLSPEFVSKLANDGNRVAKLLWKKFGHYLGIGIATLINVLGVETFVIGGGIAESWNLFIGEARKNALRHTYKFHSKKLKIIRAELGVDAGIIGAALCALEVTPPQNQ